MTGSSIFSLTIFSNKAKVSSEQYSLRFYIMAVIDLPTYVQSVIRLNSSVVSNERLLQVYSYRTLINKRLNSGQKYWKICLL